MRSLDVAIAGFWARVGEPDENGCHPWLGAIHKTNGYGITPNHLLPAAYAHRIAYILTHGPIRDNLPLDHLCRNRICVNPEHLEPVTHQANILRSTSPAAQRARQTHCKRGHEFTPANTYASTAGHRSCRECHRVAQNERYHRLHSARARGKVPWQRV